MTTIENIKIIVNNKKLRFTNHVLKRMFQRNIKIYEIEECLINGEIIESYPDDYPYESYLILGTTLAGKKLHVVCGISKERELWIITVYQPDILEWNNDFKSRKEKM